MNKSLQLAEHSHRQQVSFQLKSKWQVVVVAVVAHQVHQETDAAAVVVVVVSMCESLSQ
jgi:hypothetical protein